MRRLGLIPLLSLALAGCGGGGHSATSSSPTASTAARPATTTAQATTAAPSPAPLTAEARSAATGDIPDNQVFLVFRNGGARYTIKYPEGWARQGNGGAVTFRDKNNIVRVLATNGGAVTTATARKDVAGTPGGTIASAPRAVTLSGRPAVKLTYTTKSAPNPVTGKRVTLMVDRYYLWRGGKRAVIDLGTPQGVDNVDAYRLIAESFTWR